MLASQRALTTLRAASPTGSSAPLLTFTKKTVLFMSSSARAVESDPALGKSPRIKGCLPGWEHSGAARWPLKKKKRKKKTQGICFSAENSPLSAQIVVFYKPRVPFSEGSWVSTERVDDLVSLPQDEPWGNDSLSFSQLQVFVCLFLGLFHYLELKICGRGTNNTLKLIKSTSIGQTNR